MPTKTSGHDLADMAAFFWKNDFKKYSEGSETRYWRRIQTASLYFSESSK